MISLEIAISNFKSLNYQEDPTTSISLRFGQISTTLTLTAGQGGKCLYLNLSPQQLQEIYFNYACGLFILNRSGKFFSLLSFERMNIEDKIICNQIVFYNDLREVKYQCQFSLVAKGFKNPRVADMAKIEARDNALGMFKKPPLPKQSPPKAKKEQNQGKKTLSSFLYGGKQKEPAPTGNYDNLQTLKQDLRKQSQVRANLQKSKNNFGLLPKAAMAKQPQGFEDDDPFQYNPPVMEFTNEPETADVLRVPQVEYIEYEQSHDRSRQSKARNTPKENNFLTFNKYDNSHQRVSPEPPSQFRLVKESKLQQKESKKGQKELTKEEIKMMAKEEVQSRLTKENVMIPIARGDRFELVPLSALKPEEIIEYVQRQRKTQEEAIAYEERKRRLQEKQRELQQKNRKLQQIALRRESSQKQKDLPIRRPSKQIRSSVHKQIKQQQNDEQQEEEQEQEHQDDDYMSDFESMSASNSIIRSRISSRGGNPKNISKEQSMIADQEYSAEFDSYSQSALSKTNPRNPTQSISDYSQSYCSISQSYRK